MRICTRLFIFLRLQNFSTDLLYIGRTAYDNYTENTTNRGGMKHFVILILAFAAMTFGEGFRNGTGFFVNSEYIVTAYHVVEDYDHNCYYDIQNDSCYKVHIVDYDAETDIVLLKLDEEPVEMPRVCRIEHSELPIGKG